MNIDSVGLFPQTSRVETVKPSTNHTFVNALAETNTQLNTADAKLEQVVKGDDIPLHDVMLSLNEAKLSLQFITQIRNRLLSAYQELMREQI